MYQEIARELKNFMNMKITVILIIIWALGTEPNYPGEKDWVKCKRKSRLSKW